VAGKVNGENVQGRFVFVDGDKIRFYGRFPQTGGTYTRITGTATDVRHVFTLVNPPVGYTPLSTEHIEGVRVYDYATLTCWYEPCALEIDDTFKGANVIPEKPKFIVFNDGRVFLSGSERDDDNVFISDESNPLYYPVSLPIQLPPNSDSVRGLCVYDDSIVVGREDDIYVISGKTNRSDMGVSVFQLRKLNSHTGIANQQSMTSAHNYLFFMGSDMVAYALSTTNYDEKTLATQILSKQLDLRKKPLLIPQEEIVDTVCAFHGEEWYVSINNLTLVYHYRLRAWTVFENMNANSFIVKDNKLLWGDGLARISEYGINYLDYGHPFRCFWQSKRYDMGDSSIFKQFREYYVVAFTFDDVPSHIEVTFEVDYQDVHQEMFTDSMIAYFGKAKWGERFITRNINESAPMHVGRRGRLISFKLANGYRPSAPVSTFTDLQFYPGRNEGTLVFVEDEQRYYQYEKATVTWKLVLATDFNQSMKVYQVNGDFEFRNKR
jgi:hypothetical protein